MGVAFLVVRVSGKSVVVLDVKAEEVPGLGPFGVERVTGWGGAAGEGLNVGLGAVLRGEQPGFHVDGAEFDAIGNRKIERIHAPDRLLHEG